MPRRATATDAEEEEGPARVWGPARATAPSPSEMEMEDDFALGVTGPECLSLQDVRMTRMHRRRRRRHEFADPEGLRLA